MKNSLKDTNCILPLSFDPGEAMQVDWCSIKIDIDGIRHN
jgi:hypothetical protein